MDSFFHTFDTDESTDLHSEVLFRSWHRSRLPGTKEQPIFVSLLSMLGTTNYAACHEFCSYLESIQDLVDQMESTNLLDAILIIAAGFLSEFEQQTWIHKYVSQNSLRRTFIKCQEDIQRILANQEIVQIEERSMSPRIRQANSEDVETSAVSNEIHDKLLDLIIPHLSSMKKLNLEDAHIKLDWNGRVLNMLACNLCMEKYEVHYDSIQCGTENDTLHITFDSILAESPECTWKIIDEDVPADLPEASGTFIIQWKSKLKLTYTVEVKSTEEEGTTATFLPSELNCDIFESELIFPGQISTFHTQIADALDENSDLSNCAKEALHYALDNVYSPSLTELLGTKMESILSEVISAHQELVEKNRIVEEARKQARLEVKKVLSEEEVVASMKENRAIGKELEELDRVVEEVWENERWYVHSGWTAPGFLDRPNFSDAGGKLKTPKEKVDLMYKTADTIKEAPKGAHWMWEDDWTLATSEIGEEGNWEYAKSFKKSYGPKKAKTFVRRRKWVRTRVRIDTDDQKMLKAFLRSVGIDYRKFWL